MSNGPTAGDLPSIDEVLADPAASFWLKTALRSALCRDPVDAAHDSEILARLLEERCDQNPVWELTTSVSLILPVFPSRPSRLRALFCLCARCIVGIVAQSTKSTNLLSFIMCRPQLGQLSWPHNPEPPRSPGKRDQYA
jgi:hypothetical protein